MQCLVLLLVGRLLPLVLHVSSFLGFGEQQLHNIQLVGPDCCLQHLVPFMLQFYTLVQQQLNHLWAASHCCCQQA
jgi:hypothetical protein